MRASLHAPRARCAQRARERLRMRPWRAGGAPRVRRRCSVRQARSPGLDAQPVERHAVELRTQGRHCARSRRVRRDRRPLERARVRRRGRLLRLLQAKLSARQLDEAANQLFGGHGFDSTRWAGSRRVSSSSFGSGALLADVGMDRCTTIAPSPTAAAHRFVEPAQTSPAASTPGTLVLRRSSLATAVPVRMKPSSSRSIASSSRSVPGRAPRKRNRNGVRQALSARQRHRVEAAAVGRELCDLAAIARRHAVAFSSRTR